MGDADDSGQKRRKFLRNLATGAGVGITFGALSNDTVDNATETRESETIRLDYPEVGEIEGQRDLVENYSETVEIDGTDYVFIPSAVSVSGESQVEGELVDNDGIGEYDDGDGGAVRVYRASDIDSALSGEAEDLESVYESEVLAEGESFTYGGMFGNKARVELLEADDDSQGSSVVYHLSWEESEGSFWT
jgi:hypothetical protein